MVNERVRKGSRVVYHGLEEVMRQNVQDNHSMARKLDQLMDRQEYLGYGLHAAHRRISRTQKVVACVALACGLAYGVSAGLRGCSPSGWYQRLSGEVSRPLSARERWILSDGEVMVRAGRIEEERARVDRMTYPGGAASGQFRSVYNTFKRLNREMGEIEEHMRQNRGSSGLAGMVQFTNERIDAKIVSMYTVSVDHELRTALSRSQHSSPGVTAKKMCAQMSRMISEVETEFSYDPQLLCRLMRQLESYCLSSPYNECIFQDTGGYNEVRMRLHAYHGKGV